MRSRWLVEQLCELRNGTADVQGGLLRAQREKMQGRTNCAEPALGIGRGCSRELGIMRI